jgi:hypothetical protein
MVRIAITVEAFKAVAATLPFGDVGYERDPNAQGERMIWLEAHVVDKLTAMRRPGESYSDVILRLIELSQRDAPLGRLG